MPFLVMFLTLSRLFVMAPSVPEGGAPLQAIPPEVTLTCFVVNRVVGAMEVLGVAILGRRLPDLRPDSMPRCIQKHMQALRMSGSAEA